MGESEQTAENRGENRGSKLMELKSIIGLAARGGAIPRVGGAQPREGCGRAAAGGLLGAAASAGRGRQCRLREGKTLHLQR